MIINQKKQRTWDHQAMKVECPNPDCKKYLQNIDERPTFKHIPVCELDGKTRYIRMPRGKGEIWECPAHPKQCKRIKVVPGDPQVQIN